MSGLGRADRREAGLTEPEIEALRDGADPGFTDKQEQVAYSAFDLSIAFDCSLCRSLLRLIAPSEAIVRAERQEQAAVTFKPSGMRVTTRYGSPSFGGS